MPWIALVVAAIAIAVGGYFIFYRKKAAAIAIGGTVQPSDWSFEYSPGMPTQLPKDTAGSYYIDFPTKNGVHYVIKAAPKGVVAGQTITMVFNVSGDGTLAVADPADIVPATVRLHLQGSSGVNDRWFQHNGTNLTIGDHTVSLPLSADSFGGVGGGVTQSTDFATAIRNLVNIGFTFGGQYFAGHGVYAKTGNVRFTLKSFTVQ